MIIANGRYVAGGIPVAPEAGITDALLDIVLIPERGPTELAILAAQILLGKHLGSDAIIFRRAKRIAIKSRPGMWFNVDGELIGNQPATFESAGRIAVRSRSNVNSKILTLDQLRAESGRLRLEGKRLVATNGCFDILHVGHVRYLAAARKFGDVLVVGLNGDDSVRQLKGANRPVNRERDRAEVLTALESVDYLTIFPEKRAADFLRAAQPAVYAKAAITGPIRSIPKNGRF